ncbi:MAG TPA: FAD-dependent oxidoreductase, partial [Gaiellaceae bacterium]|nr:FAD-dependent oxidoreductase [Gaiellaceae bacterium]
MRVAVVGGGLAGLAAALALADRRHEVVLYEARPTLGGAVQTLPERDGDPPPPPDNGQHIALGCFTAYRRFLARIGKERALRREPLRLPVIDERGRVATIGPGLRLLGYSHLPVASRIRVARTALLLRGLTPSSETDTTFAAVLRARGQRPREIDRFWDVFIRPALNLPSEEAGADYGIFTVQTAFFGGRGASDLLLPTEPLGEMHGGAAGRALEQAGAEVRLESRVESLVELDADAIVVALPPPEAARLLGREPPELDDSPIVSVHLLFDRPVLRHPLAALLDSPAHWVFDRGALTGHRPADGQYLTVVSSGVPDLLEVRGRALVDLMADALRERLGHAELLWSRVS